MNKGKLAAVNGLEMYYEIHGEGEPLILLHGASAPSRCSERYCRCWRKVAGSSPWIYRHMAAQPTRQSLR
jgi:pimeloyl-ACP methyl ester carboxylesterase